MLKSFGNWFEKKNPEAKDVVISDDYGIHGITESGEGRPLEAYIKEFNIELSELTGKRILDLGAGLENNFAEELEKGKIGAEVISLSPDFSNKNISEQTRAASPGGKLVAGLGSALPFADESFDRIYALHVYEHIKTREALYGTLEEMIRTLRPEGVAKMGPFYDIPNYPGYFEEFSENEVLKEILAKYNATFGKEDVSPDLPPVKVKDGRANSFYVRGYSIVLKKLVKNKFVLVATHE